MLVLAVTWSMGGTWLGCSPKKDYRVLSFFFDGVPDPNAPPGRANADDDDDVRGNTSAIPRVVVYSHKPYADNQCNSCHAGSAGSFESFSKLDATVCKKCHEKVPRQYAVMHGPVAVGECLWCHVPHESTIKGMLKDPAPAVCIQCHSRNLLSTNPPEHQMDKSSCLDCHVAHGGERHGLLAAGYLEKMNSPLAPPTTRGVP